MITLTGLLLVEFRCPKCRGAEWGSRGERGERGQCETPGPLGVGQPCGYTWPRREDFRVFYRNDTGDGFRSPEELAAVLRLTAPPGRPPFEQLLQDLLGQVMQRPPTVGAVALWTRHEQHEALRWATHEILADCIVSGPDERLTRPHFIEDGAATA